MSRDIYRRDIEAYIIKKMPSVISQWRFYEESEGRQFDQKTFLRTSIRDVSWYLWDELRGVVDPENIFVYVPLFQDLFENS
jgi:hypothetical protein